MRPLRLWRSGLAVLVLTVVSMVVASQARSPREVAARSEPPPPSEITVPVTRARLVHTVTVSCAPQADAVPAG